MNEETQCKDARTVELTIDEYLELERALQWPEDLAKWDRTHSPTNMAELLGNFAKI